MRTKDPGAPRNHSRVRCENANQRVWRASLTPPTTLMLEHRTRPPRANQAHQVQGRSLAPAAVNHITLRNCHPERGVFSFAERGTRARRANAARFLRGNKSHAWRTSKIGVKLESREAAKECSPRRKPWVEYRDDASPRGAKETNPKYISRPRRSHSS